MKRFAAILAISLCSCTTTVREMRGHEPRATYDSARSEPELERCLAGNLSWAGNPAIIHGPAATELSFGSGGTTVLMVTLTPSGTGTKVEARELLAYGARIRHNIEACVSGRDQ